MSDQVVMEVPHEIEKLIREDSRFKKLLTSELVNRIAYIKTLERSIFRELLNIVVGTEDVHLKNEGEILEMLRTKIKKG